MNKRKDGLWREKLIINGKEKYFYGKTKTEVANKIRAFQSDQFESANFDRVALAWWEQHEPTLSRNTVRPYKAALDRAVEYFGKRQISSIRPVDISRFLSKAIADNNMADKTARTQLMIINLIERYAVEQGFIDSNRARDLSVPKGLQHKPREMPSSYDIKAIKENINQPFGLFPMIALFTGLRKGEILALTRDDFNFDDQTISVTKSFVFDKGRVIQKDPKTLAGIRVVSIPNILLPYIPQDFEGYLFNKNGKPLTENMFERRWNKYKELTGVSCDVHQLRHAYATALYEHGCSPEDMQLLLGHAQIETTMDIYTHIRDKHRKTIAKSTADIDIN